ncbi:MAG TPA: hypothetical protein VIH66_05290 [Gammaproteobacteria bacterium]
MIKYLPQGVDTGLSAESMDCSDKGKYIRDEAWMRAWNGLKEERIKEYADGGLRKGG